MNGSIVPGSNALPIGVLLVDDEPAMLLGLELLIDGEAPRMAVVGKASGARAALQLAMRLRPDVILLDLDLGGDSGIDLLPQLLPWCRGQVVIFTGVRDAALHERAVREGAAVVVSKEESAEVLLQAIHWTAGAERRAYAPFRIDATPPHALNADRPVPPAEGGSHR